MHAGPLVARLLEKFPGARIIAFGGERVTESGAEVRYRIEDYAIIGFSGVVTKFPRLMKLERGLKKILDGGVDLFIPVDYPGLNIRLAEHAKKCGVPVLYYISPQVWAWGSGRARKIAEAVDRMAVILPFEEGYFQSRGMRAEFVGHPLVEDHPLPDPLPQPVRSDVGLLPGSRTSEVRRILPILLAAAAEIRLRRREERFSIGRSPFVPRRIYEKIVSRHAAEFGAAVDIEESTQDIMARSRLLLVASGTATLEGALHETPLIVVYRMSRFNYFIARRLVTIDNIGLVNIILDAGVCPEFVQARALPGPIAAAAVEMLEDGKRREDMVEKFKGLRTMLKGTGGCRRVAEISEELLDR
jgi:lipid-A-disaccharide synthase